MTAQEQIINFDDAEQKRRLLSIFGATRGIWRVEWRRYRKRRSDQQNRWYWPCYVKPLADYLRSQGWDGSEDDAHELMKAKFLRREVTDPKTGEVIGEFAGSTAALDVEQFSEYLDRCGAWLAEMFGIIVPPANGGDE